MTNIINKDIIEFQNENMKDYYEEILLRRPIPDVRDGLKVIQRRILYGMNEMRVSSSSKHVKCGKIVGIIMGSFHPHGKLKG